MTTDPAKRTDRTARKATAEQVTGTLPQPAIDPKRARTGRRERHPRPARLPLRPVQGRERQPRRIQTEPAAQTGRVPPSQDPRRLRPGAWPRSPPTGDANSSSPSSSSTTPRTSCSTDDAGMRAGPRLAIAIGTLACRRGIPVRFFTASGLIMRLRKAKSENRLDQELKTIGKADLLVIERARLPAHRHRRRQAPVPGSSPTATKGEASSSASNLEFGRWGDVFGDGDMAAAVIDRIVHHGRIIRFHGESYRNTHSLMK